MTEGIGDISVLVLAVLGLAGIFTNVVASVATIVAGAVFVGDSMQARSLRTEGAGAGFFSGLAGIILGILSFFQPTPWKLVAVAVLAYGAAMVLSGGTLARLNASHIPEAESAPTSSGSLFMGLAVTVLGILAVIGLAPATLALVGLLCLGAGALFSGSPPETSQT